MGIETAIGAAELVGHLARGLASASQVALEVVERCLTQPARGLISRSPGNAG